MRKEDKFEYGSFIVHYYPQSNVYYLSDVNYLSHVGRVSLKEGPGWLIEDLDFLDAQQAQDLADFLRALNSGL